MSKHKFRRKHKSYNTNTIENSKPVTKSMSNPSLLHHTNVTSKSDTYQLNSTPLDNAETETPVKIYSKTNFSTIFLTSVVQHFSPRDTS